MSAQSAEDEEFLELLGKASTDYLSLWSGMRDDFAENPDNYIVEKKKREEIRQIGRDHIPKIGQMISEATNEYFSEQSDKFKVNFPELNYPNIAGVMEKVDIVEPYGQRTGEVKLTITRYIIKQK